MQKTASILGLVTVMLVPMIAAEILPVERVGVVQRRLVKIK